MKITLETASNYFFFDKMPFSVGEYAVILFTFPDHPENADF